MTSEVAEPFAYWFQMAIEAKRLGVPLTLHPLDVVDLHLAGSHMPLKKAMEASAAKRLLVFGAVARIRPLRAEVVR